MTQQKAKTGRKPYCPECGSGYVYMRSSGSVVCRRCGKVSSEPEWREVSREKE